MKKLLVMLMLLAVPSAITLVMRKPAAPDVYKVEINSHGMPGPLNVHGYGSAFNYRGYLVTAGHVCTGAHGGYLGVINTNTHELEYVKIIKNFPNDDVCIAQPVKFKHSDIQGATTIEENAFSIGYAMGWKLTTSPLIYQTSSHYMINGLGQVFEDAYSGLIIPGMSGGPVVDSSGKLVGLNSASNGIDLALAVPVSLINKLINSLKK